MASYVKYEVFVEDLIEGVHDFDGHVFKIALTNTAPNVATHAVRADITELSTSGGYTSGGNTTTISTSRSGGTAKVTGTDPTAWTGSGGGFTFRYAVLYNDTPSSPADPLISYWDYGSSQLVAAGETLTVDLDATNGIFTIT
jgi:hypothetical protein